MSSASSPPSPRTRSWRGRSSGGSEARRTRWVCQVATGCGKTSRPTSSRTSAASRACSRATRRAGSGDSLSVAIRNELKPDARRPVHGGAHVHQRGEVAGCHHLHDVVAGNHGDRPADEVVSGPDGHAIEPHLGVERDDIDGQGRAVADDPGRFRLSRGLRHPPPSCCERQRPEHEPSAIAHRSLLFTYARTSQRPESRNRLGQFRPFKPRFRGPLAPYRWPRARLATSTVFFSMSNLSVSLVSTSPPVTRMKNVSSPYSIE